MSPSDCPDCGTRYQRDAHGDWYCPKCGNELTADELFTLDVRSAREISELPEPDESDMLVGPLVVRGSRTIIVAAPGHGKTTLALQLAAAALTGWEVFGYFGAGVSCVLVVDLEQGIRSIKRSLKEAGLAERDDVFYVAAPDGLALDSDEEHRDELERVVAGLHPDLVVLDPYYKAHRGDSNEERGVVDLMRHLDALRSRHGFALILPAHPRKDQTGRDGARKLKLDDVAGSGAVTRGAELVLGLERLSHGYARIRILKDRDGDLAVGEEWPLLFTRGEGFRLDPKADSGEHDLEERALELGSDGNWRLCREYASQLGVRLSRARQMLEGLVESGKVETLVGPPGRSRSAIGYRTDPESRDLLGITGSVIPVAVGDPGDPDVYRDTSEPGSANGGSSSAREVRDLFAPTEVLATAREVPA